MTVSPSFSALPPRYGVARLARFTPALVRGTTARHPPPPPLCSQADRLAYVERHMADRQQRRRHFSDDWFSDPAWNMLLDCYAARLAGHEQTVTNLCIASGVSTTTALRYLQAMANKGLVERRPDPVDRRRIRVALTPHSERAMQDYFDAITGACATLD